VAVMRVTSCDFSVTQDRCILSVDVFYPDDADKEPRTFIVIATRQDITDVNAMKEFVEKDILSQRQAIPNWSGMSWKTTRV